MFLFWNDKIIYLGPKDGLIINSGPKDEISIKDPKDEISIETWKILNF